MQRVVIVSGSVGVGKTDALRSMREALAERVNEVAVLETDDFYRMIDPYWTMPPSRVDRYFELSGWLLRETALGFLRAEFDWVAIASNGLWREAHVREFARPFVREAAEAHHITLDPGDDVMRTRMQARESANVDSPTLDFDEGLQMQSDIRRCCGSWTHMIDNGAMTPAETAVAIYDAAVAGKGRL